MTLNFTITRYRCKNTSSVHDRVNFTISIITRWRYKIPNNCYNSRNINLERFAQYYQTLCFKLYMLYSRPSLHRSSLFADSLLFSNVILFGSFEMSICDVCLTWDIFFIIEVIWIILLKIYYPQRLEFIFAAPLFPWIVKKTFFSSGNVTLNWLQTVLFKPAHSTTRNQ